MANSKTAVAAAGGANVAARSSLWDSIRACGIFGTRVKKEELKRRIVIPLYLRSAMAAAIRDQDASVGVSDAAENRGSAEADEMPEAPIVVFVNSRSGGRHGPELKIRLQELISEEQVAGGDGTVGWILGSLGELFVQKREPVPPTGIIPLGTGNDLSRSFGWGGSFPFAWKSAVKQSLLKAVSNPVQNLDSWHVTIIMQETQELQLPYCLKSVGEYDLNEDVDIQRELHERISCFEGVFYNYLSIGMDAQVAFGFHHLRDTRSYLAQGPISNKLIYAGFSCTQGWFFTPCVKTPNLRGLKNILSLYIKKVSNEEWEKIPIPASVRSLVLLNLDSYGSGSHPWGHPTPEYLDKRRFYEARADDGLLEIFGMKQGWHASMVMVEIISAVHIAQAAAVKLELRGGDWNRAYLQTDGEPWKHPLNREHSTFLKIKRVPFQSRLINGK